MIGWQLGMSCLRRHHLDVNDERGKTGWSWVGFEFMKERTKATQAQAIRVMGILHWRITVYKGL